MIIRIASALAAAAFAASLAGPALAQQQNQQHGVTSGPAVGTPVVPSATAQKQNSSDSGTTANTQGAVAVGAPGTTAKPGTEAGPAPKPGQSRQ